MTDTSPRNAAQDFDSIHRRGVLQPGTAMKTRSAPLRGGELLWNPRKRCSNEPWLAPGQGLARSAR